MADKNVVEFFKNTISLDLLRIMCGDLIGEGAGRTVYEFSHRPDLVIKIETPAQSFQNVKEWEVWNAWRDDKEVACWLAPCEDISECGSILIQKRTTSVPADRFPKKLPKFLTDTSRHNFGMLNKKFVCHDYALVRVTLSVNMVKADWWS